MDDLDHSPGEKTEQSGGKPPHNDSSQEPAPINVKGSPFGGKERILFVDDDVTVVELNQLRLSRLGYDVVGMTSSTEALEIFQKEPDAFDVVFIDYAMPNLTGTELAAELLKIKPTIPIILCTGYFGPISQEDMQKMGIKAFLLKPPGKDEIAETIRRVLDTEISRPAGRQQ